MHATLVTAPTITEFRAPEEIASRAVQAAALQPQLGILSVAATLHQWGDTPHILDANAEYLRFASAVSPSQIDEFAHHLAREAVKSNADLYGFSSICSTFPLSLRIAAAVKALRPYATILFGGPQASVVDEAVLQTFPCVDYILRGEVEHSLPHFLHQFTGDSNFSNVPGLTYRDHGIVRRTSSAPAIEDLDALPSPAYHLSSYLRDASSASIELGRGCPFSCTFCSTNDFFRRRFRLRSPQRVLADMRSIESTYGIRHFELVHDMFTVDRKRVVAFCEAMQNSGENYTWDCSARTDCVDDELLEQMAASGCRGLFFGIESGSRRMQRIIDKDLDPEKAEAILQSAERLGIRTTASLIVGFPQEEWQDVEDTLHIFLRSASCSRSHPQLNLLAPLAGTPLHRQHAGELVLEDTCSDMSHQGLGLHADDLALIRDYPEIFPNFYAIPSPHLDRTTLFELREFLGMMTEHFRWLLCAIARTTGPLTLLANWTTWRIQLRGVLPPGELRRYYAQPAARLDTLRFLRESTLTADSAVDTLLTVEETLVDAQLSHPFPDHPEALALAPNVRIIALQHSLPALMHSLAAGTAPQVEPTFYATRRLPGAAIRLNSISPLLAQVLNLLQKNQWQHLGGALQHHFALPSGDDVPPLLHQLTQTLRSEHWLQ